MVLGEKNYPSCFPCQRSWNKACFRCWRGFSLEDLCITLNSRSFQFLLFLRDFHQSCSWLVMHLDRFQKYLDQIAHLVCSSHNLVQKLADPRFSNCWNSDWKNLCSNSTLSLIFNQVLLVNHLFIVSLLARKTQSTN